MFLMAQDALGAGRIVDRILAVVNEEVITLSAVRDDLKIKRFLEGEEKYSLEISPDVIYEYIKRRLILQEDKKIKLSSIDTKEIENNLNKLIIHKSEQEMNVLGLDVFAIKSYLLEQMIIQTHIERRLGFLVRIDEKEIDKELQEKRIKMTSESIHVEIIEEVRKGLFKKKLEEQKKLWLEELMGKANIRVNR